MAARRARACSSGGRAISTPSTSTVRESVLRALDAPVADARIAIGADVVAVTHLDRVYWPAEPALASAPITKRDFLRYLVRMADLMLPHLRDRPLTLFRWPEGVAGRRVLMKHWEIRLPVFVERVAVFSESKGAPDQYILCNNLATLVWLGHMGTLEFHAWHSRVTAGPDANCAGEDFTTSLRALHASVLERPDYLLFAIDPFIYSGKEARARQPEFTEHAFAKGREVALRLKDTLDALRLESFVKTSGKTGLHVLVPIQRTLRYDAVREVARFIAAHLCRAHRESITVDWSIERRTGKVFIDFNMNVRGKSMTAPYSPRGLAAAPVSMPLRWQDLARAHPLDYRVGSLTRPPRADPWRGIAKASQALEDRLAAASA